MSLWRMESGARRCVPYERRHDPGRLEEVRRLRRTVQAIQEK